ncbi:hypothetical protein BBJ28_00014166 [Nothophytophthora sp. Chile5]|nr:hypothetical protein BBJ28_00014166 [Nothophytophthora sp. Chile5]
MLAFYASQDEAQRLGTAPKRVLEVVDVQVTPSLDSKSSSLMTLQYLDSEGSGTLQCRADSRETQQIWLEALQHALEEPDRLAQEEIAEAQQELQHDAQRHHLAVQQAAEAVQAAGRQQQAQVHSEAALQQNREAAVELQSQLEATLGLHLEAQSRLEPLRGALGTARHRVYSSTLERHISYDEDMASSPAMEAVERLAAQVEVAASAEASHSQQLQLLEQQLKANAQEQQQLLARAQHCGEESQTLRLLAAKSLEKAQQAKQRSRRIASWSGDGTADGSATPSYLDPLAEGYLLCQHPTRSTMHRRYYVLVGNTLCWYLDQDGYANHMASPSGVVHIAEVSEWDGNVKPRSPLRRLLIPISPSKKGHTSVEAYPHAFAVLTVEGKTLYCSAPLRKSREEWLSALHVGLTMPPLSPHRAQAAKARRDSFDLLASTSSSPRRQGTDAAEPLGTRSSAPSSPHEATRSRVELASVPSPAEKVTLEHAEAEVVVEGYLVKKSLLAPVMKKKYCVLRGLTFHVFASHTEAAVKLGHGEAVISPSRHGQNFLICGVSDWNGHTALMHYSHGFQLQTVEPQTICCSAPSEQEKARWLRGVQEALLQRHSDGVRSPDRPQTPVKEDGGSPPQKSYLTARRELLAVLQSYYAEHHPSKLGDVSMLFSRYQGREQALIQHLDRLYGTAMGQDASVETLLSTLAASAPPPSPRSEPVVPSSPSSSAMRGASPLSDWLRWNNDAPASFCVLSGSRLERFESQEEHRNKALPLVAFIVSGVHDYPAPSPTTMRSSTSGDQQLRFFLSGEYETETQGLVGATELLVLETTTMDAKQRWMASLRSGLGLRIEPPASPVAESTDLSFQICAEPQILVESDAETALPPPMAPEIAKSEQQQQQIDLRTVTEDEAESESESASTSLQALLTAFYQEHNPVKVAEVATLLHTFQGRESALLEQIDRVYSSHLATDPICVALCAETTAAQVEEPRSLPSSSVAIEAEETGRPDEAVLMEGYLMKRGHRVPSMRKRYCVLVGDELSYFTTQDDSKSPATRLGSFRVEIVGDWHGKTSTHAFDHGLELETRDGKSFFCAASSALEKQQWADAFRHGIALSHRLERQAAVEEAVETELERQFRAQFREKLAEFYRLRNPSKLSDLDLLLSCYRDRELALLQAVDEAYGSTLAVDDSFLALLPPSPKHTTALATLKLDGFLKKSGGDSIWTRSQSLYVALDGLTLAFFASREGFKSGVGLRDTVTVLAVKDGDGQQSSSCRFAVETSEHEWLHFEAHDVLEKRLWLQVLRAALDTVLAQSLLAEEQRTLQQTPDRMALDASGFLLLRLDFDCQLEEHRQQHEFPTAIEQRYVALTNSNELVISHEAKTQTRFHAVGTRAWVPGTHSWPVTAANRVPRFPFQIVTQEQFVLSCSAATDVERASWIRHLRVGAEQATALEMLEEQLLETKAPLSPGRRSLIDQQERAFPGVCGEEEAVVELLNAANQQQPAEEEPSMTGYLAFRLFEAAGSSGESQVDSQTPSVSEGFVVLTMRAQLAIYEDEAACDRQEPPLYNAQAVELSTLDDQLLRVEQQDAASPSLAFAVRLLPLKAPMPAVGSGLSWNDEANTSVLELLPSSPSQRELWLEAFTTRLDVVRGEALLNDEKLLLKLERDEAEAEDESEEKLAAASKSPSPTAADVRQEGESRPPSTSHPASMEGTLTPWQASTSPIRLPGSSKLRAVDSVYAVLLGCELRCFRSKEVASAAAKTGTGAASLPQDVPPSLDIEITAVSLWEAPSTNWLAFNQEKQSLGFQVEAKGSRHGICFTAPSLEAKQQWLQSLQHELDLALAERHLDEAREVEAHLVATAASEEEPRGGNGKDASVQRTEGELRVRHHNLGSIWRDRFVVLEGSTLSIFPDRESFGSSPALEKHELVGVEKWHPVFSSIGRGGTKSLKRSGFRVETSSGVYLECVISSDGEGSRWRGAIAAATTKAVAGSGGSASRDPALPFIVGARMEGCLKLKDQSATTGKKAMLLPRWQTRYCVVLGVHLLVYASQSQAVSAGETATGAHPVAVHDLAGVAVVEEDDEASEGHEFSIDVAAGRQVTCRASSSLERKRWLNAIEDELQSEKQTSQQLESSMKQREEKLAAREAVKSKLQEVQSDARRLSAMLDQALQSARDESDWSSSSDAADSEEDDEVGPKERLTQRRRSDFIDGSPESSPMRRNLAESIFPFDAVDVSKPMKQQTAAESASSFASFISCVFRCLPLDPAASSKGKGVVAPLGIPGFPSAAVYEPQYTCDYYQADGYHGLTD